MLLKEYLPGARAVAANELQMLVHLCNGLPARKWHAANAPMAAELPIVPILGARGQLSWGLPNSLPQDTHAVRCGQACCCADACLSSACRTVR